MATLSSWALRRGGSCGRGSRTGWRSCCRTPYIAELLRPIAPGLRTVINEPLPGGIDWRNRIRLDGMPVAILGRSSGQLDVQIPWGLRTGPVALTIDVESTSPLVQSTPPVVLPLTPGLPSMPSGARGVLGGRLLKGDFSGSVTQLLPGDIVHLYLTGLGAVTGAVQTGMPAPLNDLRPLASTVRCGFLPGPSSEAETLFAGLAPGMVGIYQVTLRAPTDVPATPTGMQCSLGSGGGFGFIVGSLP